MVETIVVHEQITERSDQNQMINIYEINTWPQDEVILGINRVLAPRIGYIGALKPNASARVQEVNLGLTPDQFSELVLARNMDERTINKLTQFLSAPILLSENGNEFPPIQSNTLMQNDPDKVIKDFYNTNLLSTKNFVCVQRAMLSLKNFLSKEDYQSFKNILSQIIELQKSFRLSNDKRQLMNEIYTQMRSLRSAVLQALS